MGSAKNMRLCSHCGKSISDVNLVGRADECPFCHADLHCCLNCRFYERAVYNECVESQAERVLEKEKSNFCGFFSYRNISNLEDLKSEHVNKRHNPLDNLFKK